jgi:hypothetical protein
MKRIRIHITNTGEAYVNIKDILTHPNAEKALNTINKFSNNQNNKILIMDEIILKPEFEKKLKKLKIKTKFLKNCRNPKWRKDLRSADFYRRKMNEANSWPFFIDYAFQWVESPEGHEFWKDIANK